jgi:lon-related putative ATP-dependent protease
LIPKPIESAQARRGCDLSGHDFRTTAELEPLEVTLGQPRALQALELGVGIRHDGYNIFVLGPPASGRHGLVDRFLGRAAEAREVPPDWCHVHNFEDDRRPRLLALPSGTGCRLRRDMERFAEDVRSGLSTSFESDEYQTRRQVLDEELKARSEAVFGELEKEAKRRGLAVLRTPLGVAFAPLKDGEVSPPEEFRKLPEEERQRIQNDVAELQENLQKSLDMAPRWERERQAKIRELDREVVRQAVAPLIEEIRSDYEGLAAVSEFLEAVQQDVLEKHREILMPEQGPMGPLRVAAQALRRYHVNLLVDNSSSHGAPVIYENNPTLSNLLGRIEHSAREGVLTTDFTLVKAGSLHRANGGYLILDARRLLTQPFAYDALKRALQSRRIRIESPAEAWSLVSTISLEPEPVPLDAKVVLIGEPMLYYLLAQHDPDFGDLFKVAADFDPELDREGGNELLYARLLTRLIRERELRPFDASGLERVIEESARLAGDASKLSARVEEVVDVLREADYQAGLDEAESVSSTHVARAVEARSFRLDRLRERSLEMILRETVLIDTSGEKVGQVNALSVLQLGQFAFGRPSRISARIKLGKGNVLDIEREVDLSGPIHSKGVLILSGYLGGLYGREAPLSMSASLVFEQSYGGVDGDSASSTELYVLLSALADLPLKQSLAVTGSVNQHGEVQAVGGVNHKIEGFFDLCQARGLTGEQGVLIPHSNLRHLMLRSDVVEAIDEGRFFVYPVARIDEGLELLTGVEAGSADAEGRFPEGSVHGRVQSRLAELGEAARRASSNDEEKA